MRDLRITGLFLALLLQANLSGCASVGGTVSGQVIDAESREPLSGAFVAIAWRGERVLPFDSRSECIHADLAVTDDAGRFRFPSWAGLDGPLPVIDVQKTLVIHKPGYMSYYMPGDSQNVSGWVLKKFSGKREEYLDYLKLIPRRTGCTFGGSSRKNLYELYKDLYYEAKSLAVTRKEKEGLEWFREVAAGAAVARDGDLSMDGTEYQHLIDEFLKENLE